MSRLLLGRTVRGIVQGDSIAHLRSPGSSRCIAAANSHSIASSSSPIFRRSMSPWPTPPRATRSNRFSHRSAMVRSFKSLLALALLLSCLAAAAQTDTVKSPTVGQPDVGSRTILGITLGRANLAQVQAKFGPAKLWRDGDASTAEMKVCYLSAEPDAVAIVFASNAEMAGPPENQVTDIRIVELAAYKDRSNCRNLTIPGNEVTTTNGLGLGLTRQRVRSILGAPTSIAGSTWEYSWDVDVPIPPYRQELPVLAGQEGRVLRGQEAVFHR